VAPALDYDVAKTQASMPEDMERILAYIRVRDGGEAVVNATVRARYFMSALYVLIPTLGADSLA
jgi:hypothetical protein